MLNFTQHNNQAVERFVKMKNGTTVPDPSTGKKVSEKGQFVKFTSFWQNLVKEGLASVDDFECSDDMTTIDKM